MSAVDLFETARKVARLGELGATGDEGYDELASDIDQEILEAAYEIEAYRLRFQRQADKGAPIENDEAPTCKDSLQVAPSIDQPTVLAAVGLLMRRIEACGIAGEAQTRAAGLAADIYDAIGGCKHPPSREFAIKSVLAALANAQGGAA